MAPAALAVALTMRGGGARPLIVTLASSTGLPHDAIAYVASASLMVATVETVKALNKLGVFTTPVTRKLMHMSAGPVFMLTWPFFKSRRSALWAACVPLAMTLKFALVGLGILNIEADVRTMSRSGDRAELLRGPLLYGVVFVVSTALWFRELPASVALLALCFGDGVADVFGRRWGQQHKLPWSPRKSWAGSAGFLASSFFACLCGSMAFYRCGWSAKPGIECWVPVLIACAVGAAVESLPMKDVDNILVPFAVAAVFLLTSKGI